MKQKDCKNCISQPRKPTEITTASTKSPTLEYVGASLNSSFILSELTLSKCVHKWVATWQNQQNGMCAQRSLRSAWAWRNIRSSATHWMHSEDSDRTGGCPGWSESLLGAHAVLLVLSWGGTSVLHRCCKTCTFKQDFFSHINKTSQHWNYFKKVMHTAIF